MSRFIRDLFHGSSYRHHPRYYYDDAVVSYGVGRSMLPDVVLHVPMETMKDVERVKQALTFEGVHRVRCDVASQTVIVSGNVPPDSLLRRVRWIKRHSRIISFGVPFAGPSSSYGSDYPASYNPYYALERYGNAYGSTLPMNELQEYGPILDYRSPYGTPYTTSYSGYLHNY